MSNYYIPEKLDKREAEAFEKNLRYWDKDRFAKAQANLAKKTEAETNKELTKHYQRITRKAVGQFELTHKRVLASIRDGATPTPADLYKLDSYWQLQAEMRKELRKLGNTEYEWLEKEFTQYYADVYQSLALRDGGTFNEVSGDIAQQVINQIWCADGKSWSDRIWDNTAKLQEALNEGLNDCLLLGKDSDWLTKRLTEEFNTNFYNTQTLVKTELSHIQNEAARQRYRDLGANQMQVWAAPDERQCKICGKLHKEVFPINAKVPIPAHPRCRCTIIPYYG